MKQLLILLFLFASFMLWGCGSNKAVVVNPEYKGKNFSDRTFTILPIPRDAISFTSRTISSSGHSITGLLELGGRKDTAVGKRGNDETTAEFIQAWLYQALSQNGQKLLGNIQIKESMLPSSLFPTQIDSTLFDARIKYLQDDTLNKITFYIPKKSIFDSADTPLDLAVIINEAEFAEVRKTTPPSFQHGFRGTYNANTSIYIEFVLHYIFWDYKKSCEVAYGSIEISDSFGGIKPETLDEAFYYIAKRIFGNEPFELKKNYGPW